MKTVTRNAILVAFLISISLFSLLSFSGSRFAIDQMTVKSSMSTVSSNVSSSLVLFDKSSHVLIGNVLAVESRWDERAASIFTYATLQVEQRLKGNLTQDYVVIKYQGGEVGNMGLVVSSEPHFIVGEKVKMFLKRNDAGYFSVVDGINGEISLAASATSSGYAYSGIHWTDSDLPVSYYINQNGTPDVPGTIDEFNAVKASFQTWEDDSGSYMDYTYMGTTWRANQTDGYNVVSWLPIDGPGGTLAVTYSYYNPATGRMIEFDMVFDEDDTWSATGEPGKFDIQNVGTHEAGHTLLLEDLYGAADSEETMYRSCALGEVKKRTLAAGDIAGIRYIYPMAAPPPPVTTTITTNPPGLQIQVDGISYTSPQSFMWAPGTIHTANVVSPQIGGTDIRYTFSAWSDGGSQQHTFTVGTAGTTLSASFVTQYFVTVSVSGLKSVFPALITFTQAGQSRSTSTAGSWSDWCDDGTLVTVDSYVNGEDGERWITHDATSWAISSPLSEAVNYIKQYRISMRFLTDDSAVALKPTSVQILGASPNSSLLTLKYYSNVWLDNVKWTLKKVLWQGSNVIVTNVISVNLGPYYQWTVICQVYPISFQTAFKNFKGAALSELPSGFTLLFPNGTISEQLNPSTVYYIQNGETEWQSITWHDTEVAPSGVSFDAASGNPTVKCRVYDFSIEVSDALGFPVGGADVSVELPDGRIRTVQTGSDGVALIRMVPAGEFTAETSFLAQRVSVSGDVAEAASTSVEVKLFLGLFSFAIVLSVCVVLGLVAISMVFSMLKRRQKVSASVP